MKKIPVCLVSELTENLEYSRVSLFKKKKIRFIIGPLVSHIFYLKVN